MASLAYVLEPDHPMADPSTPFVVWDTALSGAADSVSLAFAGFGIDRGPHTVAMALPANVGPQWQDVYFPKLCFSASTVDVGLVSNTVYVTLNYWNASDSPTTITDLTAIGADGVVVTGLTLPRTLRATEEGQIVIAVSSIGLPVIDALFTFNTDKGSASAEITGLRGVILPFEPDWSQAFKVSRFRKTVRLSALSTAEERRAMEACALLRLSFTVLTMSAVETEQLKRLGLQVGSNMVAVPLWPEGLRSTDALPASATILPTDPTSLYDIAAGDMVMIWEDSQHWVLKTVASVQPMAVCVTQALGSSFDSGAWVVPMRTGKLTSRPSFTQITDEVANVQIDFEEQV